MPYDVLHSARGEWLAAKEEIIAGIQSDSASALETLKEGYRRSVEHSSEVLFASFLELLDDLGLREKTAIALVSDHGESWGERFADKAAVKGTYHLHGAALYDEIAEVPLVLSAPGLPEGLAVSSQVSLVDLMPTLAELAGSPLDGLDGRSLLPLVDGTEQGDRPVLIVGTDNGAVSQLAVRVPPWKLIHRLESGADEAYRLDLDPRELHSRPEDAPPELRSLLEAELAVVSRERLSAEDEALVERRLADLGYL